jgi:Tfp pilus assembly protein PilF
MAELTRAERHDLITEAVSQAKVNWAYVALAQLIREKHVRRILTTNFDPLVMRACALVGVYPAIYDLAASADFKPSFVSEPAIFHLHGQHSGFAQLHTEEEVKKHFDRLKPVFADAGTGRPWIVVGYSGDNDPVFDHLAGVQQFEHGLYWIGLRDSDPAEHVRQRLLDRDKDAFYVRGFDADTFFVRLAQALDCFPPAFIAKPFSHLKDCLGELTPFEPGEKGGPNILDFSRTQLDEAIRRFEESGRGDVGKLLAGDLGGVATAPDRESASDEDLLAKAWALVMEGNDLSDRADKKSGQEAADLFAQGARLYEHAVKIMPDLPAAWCNWGVALSRQAEGKTGDEKDALLKAASEKYARAVEIKPDDNKYWYNWGGTLVRQAGGKTGDEKDALLKAASGKYARAVEIKPDDNKAWHNWGVALVHQAEGKTGDEKDALLKAACEKYARAVEITPDYHEAWNGWGNALLELAKASAEASDVNRFLAAREKLLKAEEGRSGSGAYNLACISALMGSEEECRRWLLVARKAGTLPSADHLRRDPDLLSVRSLPWFADFLQAESPSDSEGPASPAEL